MTARPAARVCARPRGWRGRGVARRGPGVAASTPRRRARGTRPVTGASPHFFHNCTSRGGRVRGRRREEFKSCMKLSALFALQLAASAFAFSPQTRGQPRPLSPSPLARPRLLAAPQANGIKITSVNSAAARAAARREAAQPPVPPPVPQAQAVPQQANPPSVPMPQAVQPPVALPVPQQPSTQPSQRSHWMRADAA